MILPPRRRFDTEAVGDVLVVTLTDAKILDDQTIGAIGEQLCNLVDEVGGKRLLLNFGNVQYLSSPFLGVVVTLNKKINAAGGRLALGGLDPQIEELFGLTKLTKGEDDPDEDLGGVVSRLKPPRPSGGHSAALRPPPPDSA